MLPESKINEDDYPQGPNGMAKLCEDRLAKLAAQKADCRDKETRRAINKHAHLLRELLGWCKTRAGYVEQ